MAYALLAPGRSTEREISVVHSQIGHGRPVLLELQSPY